MNMKMISKMKTKKKRNNLNKVKEVKIISSK
jgi:hypothetical protein